MLLLRYLSPTLFRLKLAGLVVVGVLFLAFVAECGYLLYRQMQRGSTSPAIHTTVSEPRMKKGGER
jgi:hypothetical protein